MNFKTFVTWVLPGIFLVIFSGLEIGGAFRTAEHQVYDAWLHVKPNVEEREEILFIDVDDLAIARVGVWPWSRDIMARGLVSLAEFGAGPTIFDIEYVDDSPLAVNADILNQQIPQAFDQQFSQLTGNVQDLLNAVAAGQIPPNEAPEFFSQLQEMASQSEQQLLSRVQEVVRDNDVILGNAARANGNAWFTVNLIPEADEEVPQERVQFALQEAPLRIIEGNSPKVRRVMGLRPAIEPILGGGRGAGFPNVIIDADGTRRRIELLRIFEDEWFGQLVFTPFLDWVGASEVDVSPSRIIVRDATLPGEAESRDIRIPLAEDGTLLLNWRKGSYDESFRHISYFRLVDYQQLLEDLAFNLDAMERSGYLQYHDGNRDFLRAWDRSQQLMDRIMENGDRAAIEELTEVRAFFVEEAGQFLSGSAEQAILTDIEAGLEDPNLSEDMRSLFTDLLEEIPNVFESTRDVHSALVESRELLTEEISDSFIVIGYTGTGTTDIGVNPFENEYANVGTHGTVVNTILTGRFIDELPLWISIAIAFLLTAGYVVLSRNRGATTSLGIGFAGAGLVVAGSAGLMVGARLFLPILTPTLTTLLSSIAQSAHKYVEVAREKTYIRNAFNHYLSTDVINEILEDPDRLRLGGEKRELTAMFTDVKGFSTISEALDAEDLVRLLNRYLSEMSDIILDLRGTIDKYEGDAIISFFGAPVPYQDHAARACRAAVRMRKIEASLNDTFMEEQLSPTRLATRFGINTGEMVVGNMGTTNRMDYTIMGHSVNLAARLEGVNKQYGTWILASEMTYHDTGNEFAARRLDRVRVVGVSEPVRLFEIVDEAREVPPATGQLIDEFHEGIELFEGREWGDAATVFSRLNREFPDDGPSKTYLDRAAKFQKEAPPKNWDGVFNLTTK